MKPRYYVYTWDTNSQSWTPQSGVKSGPWSLWGLRRAILRLRAMGYPCDYSSKDIRSGDPSVRIIRQEGA